jgi:hypothetical protein
VTDQAALGAPAPVGPDGSTTATAAAPALPGTGDVADQRAVPSFLADIIADNSAPSSAKGKRKRVRDRSRPVVDGGHETNCASCDCPATMRVKWYVGSDISPGAPDGQAKLWLSLKLSRLAVHNHTLLDPDDQYTMKLFPLVASNTYLDEVSYCQTVTGDAVSLVTKTVGCVCRC